MKYSHYGWFGFCPVYIANPFGACPEVTERYWWLAPVLVLNIKLQGLAIGVCSLIDPYWTPAWKIRLSGKIKRT
jgi:hypothetical protein